MIIYYLLLLVILVVPDMVFAGDIQPKQQHPPPPLSIPKQLQAEIERLITQADQKSIKDARIRSISASTAEYRYARYFRNWKAKIERIGTLNYPTSARGEPHGNGMAGVEIGPDGSVLSINIIRSTGNKIFDDAMVRIVRLAAPFAPFQPEIRRETDVISITATWRFSPGKNAKPTGSIVSNAIELR